MDGKDIAIAVLSLAAIEGLRHCSLYVSTGGGRRAATGTRTSRRPRARDADHSKGESPKGIGEGRSGRCRMLGRRVKGGSARVPRPLTRRT